jgi:hypothetical protein
MKELEDRAKLLDQRRGRRWVTLHPAWKSMYPHVWFW